ncbi:MAG: hypothetical protein DLM54_06195, partial [Acidimicrobiales bacterium]
MANWREKMKAATHGEVSREGLDPYRAAGAGVYEYVLEVDSLRKQSPNSPNLQAAMLAGWVAFALQVMGDEMLDADAVLDPSTAHYVPRITAAQVAAFYQEVQGWMARGMAAKANPSYRLDVPVPAALPPWMVVEPCPHAHLRALRQAAGRLRDQTEVVTAGFDAAGLDSHARDLVAQGSAEAASAADYANSLWGATSGPPPPQMHEAIEGNLKRAAAGYFYLGQLLAMPSLADVPQPASQVQPGAQPEGPRSFIQTIMQSYPQMGQRRGGMGMAIGGGILGAVLGEAVAGQIFGGGGGWGGG